MKLYIAISFTCLIGLILIQQIQCVAYEVEKTTAINKWMCTCYAPSPVNKSSILESNCSSSCDCTPADGSGNHIWICSCSLNGLPTVVADSHDTSCFTACNCTSGSHVEWKPSRKHDVKRHIVVFSSILVASFAVLSLLVCYLHQKVKFRSHQPLTFSDKYTSFNSRSNLISHKTSLASENPPNVGTPARPITGCFHVATYLFGAGTRTFHGSIIQFSYSELEYATNKFSDTNIIGLGGSSYVYRGQLKDGTIVAIKRLQTEGQPDADATFSTEVELLSRLHHCHVVPLLGYCFEFQGKQTQRLLIFEYMLNGNLRDSLDGSLGEKLNWETRVTIAIGAAKGLEYLHDAAAPRILHRDVKSTNILLDQSWRAKITDLGMAKHLRADDLASSSSSPVRMQGTFGYFAPEYAIVGRASLKSDVFSFGVVLLELITGRQPIHKCSNKGTESLVIWAAPRLQDSRRVISELPDARLNGDFPEEEMQIMAYLAKECLLLDPDARPSMSDVVQILSTIAPNKRRRNITADIFQRSSIDNKSGNQLEILNESKDTIQPIHARLSTRSSSSFDSDHGLGIKENKNEAGNFTAEHIETLIYSTAEARSFQAQDAETVDLTEPWFESFCIANGKSP